MSLSSLKMEEKLEDERLEDGSVFFIKSGEVHVMVKVKALGKAYGLLGRDSVPRWKGFEPSSSAVWPWAGCLMSQRFKHLIFKMRMLILRHRVVFHSW